MQQPKKVAVIGLGYVGFPLLMALTNDTNFEAVGFDISKRSVDLINKHESPVLDPLIIDEFKHSKDLTASTDPDILSDTDLFIICVPTPVNHEFEPDYGPVISASKTAAKYLKPGGVVVLESTVNPGTCEEVMMPAMAEITDLKPGKDFDIVHAPERISPGDPKWSLKNLPRNIGGTRKEASELVKKVYNGFIKADLRVVSSLKVAEASKIIENSFRDINIAFVNELAKSFDALEIDLIETIQAASSKFSFVAHWPGPGVGGHCIPVDPYYLIKRATKAGFNHRLLKEAREINNSMPDYAVHKLMLMLNKLKLPIKGTKIALLGMSYKPGVGDLRESPSLKLQSMLLELGADLTVFDPYLPDLSNAKSLEEVLSRCEVILLATHHPEFKSLTADTLAKSKIKAVMDTRNFLDAESITEKGISYSGIGRK